jgi:GMP synthase (glutamine-hydrolysing)
VTAGADEAVAANPDKPQAPADAADSSRILILDFGGQYTQLIARRVREAGVYSEIYAHDAPAEAIAAFGAAGIILSGGPESITAAGSPRVSEAVFEAKVPVLGICYGMQALAARFGGVVEPALHREYGYAQVALADNNPLLAGLGGEESALEVWMSHGDRVERLPPGFAAIAASKNAPLAGMANVERGLYGLQFHPEVTHTQHGFDIIQRFVHDICGCPSQWTPKNIIAEHLERVR